MISFVMIFKITTCKDTIIMKQMQHARLSTLQNNSNDKYNIVIKGYPTVQL